MFRTLTKLLVVGAIFSADLYFSKSLAASDFCDTLSMKEFITSKAKSIITDSWAFYLPIGVDSDIIECEYFLGEDAHLVEANINWSGPREGVYYESIVEFTIKDDALSSWKMLQPSPSLKNHLVNNGIVLKSIEAFGDRNSSNNNSGSSENQDYYLVCISNRTNKNIRFDYKWENDDSWDVYEVKANGSTWLSITKNEIMDLEVDSSFAEGYQSKAYILEPTLSDVKECGNISGYYFDFEDDGQTITLYEEWANITILNWVQT